MRKFRQTIKIMFQDCDPAQIVFYPNYFRMFDRASELMFEAAGLPWARYWPEANLAGFPIVDAGAKFSGPARQGDEVVMESWVEEWRNRTFVVKHTITKGDRVIVEGHEIRVWAANDASAPEGIKAAPIPEEIKAKFA